MLSSQKKLACRHIGGGTHLDIKFSDDKDMRLLSLFAPLALAQLGVDVGKNGGVTVSVDGKAWLASTETLLFGDRLKLLNSSTKSASDALGDFESTEWSWSLKNSTTRAFADAFRLCDSKVVMRTSVRVYKNDRAVFRQEFPCGASTTAVSAIRGSKPDPWVITDFPKFEPTNTSGFDRCALFNEPLADTLIIEDVRDQQGAVTFGKCLVTTQGGVPIVLYSVSGSRVTGSLIFSQLTRFKTGEMFIGGDGSETAHISLGLKGTLDSIPAGFDAEWVVSYSSNGMIPAWEHWGDALLAVSGKTRVGPYEGPIVSSMGYWTDNGAYYHYGGVENASGAYQDAMKKVVEAHRAKNIPFKHWQLDSWWYPKGRGGNNSYFHHHEGADGGVYRWKADGWVFPDGMEALQKMVGLPFVQHNRFFSPYNWYKANGIAGEWTESTTSDVLPLDLETFYEFFFEQTNDFGPQLAVYEQDFCYTQYEHIKAMQTNATFADDWFGAMARHAAKRNLTMQFSMPYPREYLVTTAHPNIRTIRASHDYHAGRDQWKISRTSLLAHAVGVLPFKDTYLTNDNAETGGADKDREPNAELVNVVATLSASIVGPGDGPGLTNRTRLIRCCNEDGLVLKADRPAVMIDAQWTADAPGGEVSFTYTERDGGRTTYYILAADVQSSYDLTPEDLRAPDSAEYVAFSWKNRKIQTFSKTSPVKLKAASSQVPVEWNLYTVAPVVDGWAVIGDANKYVGASIKRVESATVADSKLSVVMLGVAREEVTVCAYKKESGQLVCTDAVVGEDGKVTVSFS